MVHGPRQSKMSCCGIVEVCDAIATSGILGHNLVAFAGASGFGFGYMMAAK